MGIVKCKIDEILFLKIDSIILFVLVMIGEGVVFMVFLNEEVVLK